MRQLLSDASLLRAAKTSVAVKNVGLRLKEIVFHFMKWSLYFFASKKEKLMILEKGAKCLL